MMPLRSQRRTARRKSFVQPAGISALSFARALAFLVIGFMVTGQARSPNPGTQSGMALLRFAGQSAHSVWLDADYGTSDKEVVLHQRRGPKQRPMILPKGPFVSAEIAILSLGKIYAIYTLAAPVVRDHSFVDREERLVLTCEAIHLEQFPQGADPSSVGWRLR